LRKIKPDFYFIQDSVIHNSDGHSLASFLLRKIVARKKLQAADEQNTTKIKTASYNK